MQIKSLQHLIKIRTPTKDCPFIIILYWQHRQVCDGIESEKFVEQNRKRRRRRKKRINEI